MSEALVDPATATAIDPAVASLTGNPLVSVVGPGGQSAAGWRQFLFPASTPAGTWRAQRWNTTTGGLVNQLGARGDFGARAENQVGWVRRFDLAVGSHLFRARFRMGPVSERPNGQAARARVFARLHPTFDIGFLPRPAYADLPAGGSVELTVSISIPGTFLLYLWTQSEISRTPGASPYCETIVGDLRVEHIHWPLPQLADAAAALEPAAAELAGARELDLQATGPDDEWVSFEG